MTSRLGLRRTRAAGTTLLLAIAVATMIALTSGSATAAFTPSITSDKSDYPPGATVSLTGSGWQSGESVHVFVNDDVGQSWSLKSNPDPVAGASGSFTYAFQLPNSFVATYSVTATGAASGTATTTFTDALGRAVDWTQCRNDNGGGSPVSSGAGDDGKQDPCNWVNGDLGHTNSIYQEGDVVPQRAIQSVPDAGSHYTTIDHAFYDSSKGAYTYDFWATPDFTVGDGGDSDHTNLTPCNDIPTTGTNFGDLSYANCLALYNGRQSVAIPDEGTYTIGATTYTYPHVSAAEADAAGDGVSRNLWISCGQVTGNQVVTVSSATQCTDVAPTILGHGDNNKALLSGADQEGPPSGSDFTQMKVDFTTPFPNEYVAVWIGGHLAKAGFWNDSSLGAYQRLGAASGAGGSYHERLIDWDESSSIGSQDNNIQTSSNSPTIVPQGSLEVVKDDLTNSGTSFSFTADSPLSPGSFSLSDDGTNASGENERTFSSLVTGGSYTLNETVPGAWTLKTVSCTGASSYTTTSTGVTVSPLQPGDNVVCTFTNDKPLVDAKALTAGKTASPSFGRSYTWGITKAVDQTKASIADGGSATFNYTVTVTKSAPSDSGWQVDGKVTVTNPNGAAVSGVDVTDAVDAEANASCSVTGGTNATIPAGDSSDFDYSCTYSAAPASSSQTNRATVTWSAETLSDGSSLAAGSIDATASIDWSTPTTTTDNCTTVSDTIGGSLGTTCATKAYTYSHSFSGAGGTCTDYGNTASFTTATTATTGSASKTVTVCVGKDLQVSKTATPAFKRTYNWTISKAATPALVEQRGGGTATFSYTVKVNETGFTDSEWKVTGTITVTNPNDWEPITFDLADAVDNGGSCTITGGGTGLTVAASSTKTASYTCTYSSAPSPASGKNTATATWSSATYSTPTGSAKGDIAFAFGGPTTTVNKTITVTDTFNGGTATPLGTLTATDSAPFASATFAYARTVNVPTSNCVKYPNTAKIVETAQSAGQTIEVCGPAKTGGLTMGYWQNKNGQTIITGGSSTGGVCNSGTWLRQFKPFQDLSATATCAQVATYVSNVIKVATCSSTDKTCNTMLKAQMLATALDVYFSDPALGGNKIAAPAPIGGVAIDLTKICKMTDSSSGATCTGSFQNVSSAFGGATSMTVLNMLLYENTASNAGGSAWYAQVKATQVLAKDAFDAINNQIAFSP